MNDKWEHENVIELLWISDERVGGQVVIRPEDFDKFVMEFTRDTARRMDLDRNQFDNDPPLKFTVCDYRDYGWPIGPYDEGYDSASDTQRTGHGPVRALKIRALKEEWEIEDWMEWLATLQDDGNTEALDDKLFRDLRAEISRDHSWRSQYRREQIEQAESWDELEEYAPVEWIAAVANRCHRDAL